MKDSKLQGGLSKRSEADQINEIKMHIQNLGLGFGNINFISTLINSLEIANTTKSQLIEFVIEESLKNAAPLLDDIVLLMLQRGFNLDPIVASKYLLQYKQRKDEVHETPRSKLLLKIQDLLNAGITGQQKVRIGLKRTLNMSLLSADILSGTNSEAIKDGSEIAIEFLDSKNKKQKKIYAQPHTRYSWGEYELDLSSVIEEFANQIASNKTLKAVIKTPKRSPNYILINISTILERMDSSKTLEAFKVEENESNAIITSSYFYDSLVTFREEAANYYVKGKSKGENELKKAKLREKLLTKKYTDASLRRIGNYYPDLDNKKKCLDHVKGASYEELLRFRFLSNSEMETNHSEAVALAVIKKILESDKYYAALNQSYKEEAFITGMVFNIYSSRTVCRVCTNVLKGFIETKEVQSILEEQHKLGSSNYPVAKNLNVIFNTYASIVFDKEKKLSGKEFDSSLAVRGNIDLKKVSEEKIVSLETVLPETPDKSFSLEEEDNSNVQYSPISSRRLNIDPKKYNPGRN